VAVGLVAVAVAALPLAYLVLRAGERGWSNALEVLGRPATLTLVWRSVELAVVVTAGCVVLGVGLAWLVAGTDLPGRRIWQVVLAVPLALPSYVAAWGWIGWFPDLGGRWGAALVLVTISYPYVYLPTLAALRRCDPALGDVARTLGRGRFDTFLHVTLPQVRLAVVGGALLVGLYVLSDFGAVATMRHQVLTHAIFRSYRASFDRTTAAVLGCVLAALAVAVAVVATRVDRRSAGPRSARGGLRTTAPVRLGRWRWPAVAVPVAVVLVAIGVPARGLRQWASQGEWAPDWSELLPAGLNTVQVASLGAVAVVALGLPLAFLVVRHPGPVAGAATAAAYAGHALPGVVVGLSVVFFGIRALPSLYQRLPMLVLAYVVLFLSLALGVLGAAVAQLPPALEDVSRTLGRGPVATWWAVTCRLVAPGVGIAVILVFLTVMKELPATLFLRPTEYDTLATRLWDHTSSLSRSRAVPYAVAIVVLAALPAALLGAVGDRGARRVPGS
jgi:iron(III) transport system permease protein